MKHVYGVGLPRTGTTSLASALTILGMPTMHYCPITNPAEQFFNDVSFVAYVSSECLIQTNDYTRDLWIILHRDEWHDSMWRLGQDLCDWQEHLKEWERIENLQGNNILHYRIEDGWKPLVDFLGITDFDLTREFPRENEGKI